MLFYELSFDAMLRALSLVLPIWHTLEYMRVRLTHGHHSHDGGFLPRVWDLRSNTRVAVFGEFREAASTSAPSTLEEDKENRAVQSFSSDGTG